MSYGPYFLDIAIDSKSAELIFLILAKEYPLVDTA